MAGQKMLRRLLWSLLATADGRNFKKEYEESMKVNCQALLEDLLCHSYNNVPYYHSLFRKVGVFKNGRLCPTNFENIPILTKETLKRRAAELVSRDCRTRGCFYDFSSGSTGQPIKFMLDKTYSKWVWATSNYYYRNILGLDLIFAREIALWAPPPINLGLSRRVRYVLNNALTNVKFLDPRRMTQSDMGKYVRTINSYKPKMIRGYAHALYEISKFIEKRKLTIHKPSAVISSAEMLHAHMREKIETVFGTRVFDFYGCREVDGTAGECRKGALHMLAFNNYVEVVDDSNNRVSEGENGRVILTNLHNYSMPFIRYQIGDMAVLGPEKCKCGNPLPTLKDVTGRVNSFLRKEDGTILSSILFSRMFIHRESVNAFRLIQEDYKKIRIMIVFREHALEESEKRGIEEEVRSVMGRDCRVIWEVVEEIPETRAGKYLPVQSLLSE